MLTALVLAASLTPPPWSARLLVEPQTEVVTSPHDRERHARLLEERAALTAARPRLGSPLLLVVGGVLLGVSGLGTVYAAIFTGIYYAFSFATGSVVLLVVGLVLLAAAVPVTTIGAVKLSRARRERRAIDSRLEELDAEEAGMQTIATF